MFKSIINNLAVYKKEYYLRRYYKILRKVAKKQLIILEQYKEAKDFKKTERHAYFFPMVKSFWEDGDFVYFLGRIKYKKYAVYPARTMMEKMLKILFFCNQKEEEQDNITIKELLYYCRKYYLIEKSYGESGDYYKKEYNLINKDGKYPEIDEVNNKIIKAFPKYEELCLKSRLVDSKKIYNIYRYFSEIPHGELIAVIFSEEDMNYYKRVLYGINRFSVEMIKVVDFFIENKTEEDVKVAQCKCDKILKKIDYSKI